MAESYGVGNIGRLQQARDKITPLSKRNRELSARGLASVFQEEGPSRTGNLTRVRPFFEDTKTIADFSRAGATSEDIQKMLKTGLGIMPPTKMKNLNKAYQDIIKNERTDDFKEGSLTAKNRIEQSLKKNPQTNELSLMDQIAENISNAKIKLGAGDEATAQNIISKKETEDARSKRAEDFRAKEEALVENFGGGDQTVSSEDAQKAAENAFNAAMGDFLNAAKGTMPEGKERTLEDYKREFAEATGVDVSGKVDKSSALMAMGLALMQNKAGKGFNVANALSAVGEAGEKALPALEKAKSQAKSAQLAAGKYSLTARNTDRAKDAANVEKARSRSSFYVVPKGEGVSGFLANIDKGSLENFNSFELDALMSNKAFSEQFDIVPGSTWSGIVEEAMKTEEASKFYSTKSPKSIELFGEGAGDLFTIDVWRSLPGSGRKDLLGGDGTGQDAYDALSRASRDLQLAKEKFVNIMPLVEGTNIFRFGIDKLDAAASAFGINLREGATPSQKLKLFLTKLSAENAKEILGEAGKTISDADRALVKSIIGDLNGGSTPEELQLKLDGLFTQIIIQKEQKILDALQTLDGYTGRNIASRLGAGPLNEEEAAELAADNAKING